MANGESFDRGVSRFGRSLAARRFRVDMSTVNAYFWVGRLSEGGLNDALKGAQSTDDPMSHLSLPALFERRLGHDVARLSEMAKTASRWRRLLTLVMITSSFERFLSDIARVAMDSDPLLQEGFPKLIDGAQLIKRGIVFPPREVSGLVVGDWNSRLACYASYFGTPPDGLRSALSDLEFLRRTRNQVAHSLGVDDGFNGGARGGRDPQASILDQLLGVRRPELLPGATVSDARLMKLMATVQRAADGIDAALLGSHIGAYEIVELYLDWISNPEGFESRTGVVLTGHRLQQENRFRFVIGELLGVGLGDKYLEGLSRFVGGL